MALAWSALNLIYGSLGFCWACVGMSEFEFSLWKFFALQLSQFLYSWMMMNREGRDESGKPGMVFNCF